MMTTPPEDRARKSARFARAVRRADRRLGIAWSRAAGWLLMVMGIAAMVSLVVAFPDDPLAGWPVLLAAALFLALARYCFRSRARLSDQLDESSRPFRH